MKADLLLDHEPVPGEGDLYALEPRSLLVEFLAGDDDGAEVDVATLTLEAHVLLPGGGVEKRTIAFPIRVAPGRWARRPSRGAP